MYNKLILAAIVVYQVVHRQKILCYQTLFNQQPVITIMKIVLKSSHHLLHDVPTLISTAINDQIKLYLGERHSGTNWITNYLKECFITNNASITVQESFKRFKHWFQEDDLSIVEEDSAVVVSMFRDPMVR